ncbi:hypothetical protein E1301_Tti023537 [Triplophysa tibetana]|uniref:HAT C-terminal dimerisation domain-containing protein n=1 Tax=Triplophysa tibetana TaxID=1572043 RepID=A0A5A9MT42_9TELE|nr:hypothetical protein E1301_Tti023537 [Triplophysa tibetana]
MKLVSSAAECVRNLRSEDEFCILCDTVTASTKDTPVSAKWRRKVNNNLTEYVVEETTGANIIDKVELRRLYFSALDHILGEIELRFSERNSKFAAALAALDPENETFLDVKSIKPIMDLTNSTIVETECIVAKQYISRIKEEESQQMMTTRRLLSEHHKVLEAMPSVLSALKLAVTFWASNAMCENSFSVLKNVFADNRRALNHTQMNQQTGNSFPERTERPNHTTARCCGGGGCIFTTPPGTRAQLLLISLPVVPNSLSSPSHESLNRASQSNSCPTLGPLLAMVSSA